MGIIYEPNLNEFFHAIAGQGAYLNGQAIRVSDNPSLASSVVATGFPIAALKRWKSISNHWIIFSEIQEVFVVSALLRSTLLMSSLVGEWMDFMNLNSCHGISLLVR